jgi:hypothetical protein
MLLRSVLSHVSESRHGAPLFVPLMRSEMQVPLDWSVDRGARAN